MCETHPKQGLAGPGGAKKLLILEDCRRRYLSKRRMRSIKKRGGGGRDLGKREEEHWEIGRGKNLRHSKKKTLK